MRCLRPRLPRNENCDEKRHSETDIPYFTEGRLGTVDEGLISSMSDEEYERYSFSWRKREVMIRNIRIASGTDFEGENK